MGRDGPAGHDDLGLPPVKLRHLAGPKLQRDIRFGPALSPAHNPDVSANRGLSSLVPEFLESQEDGVADPALLPRQMFVLFQEAFNLCLVLRGENGSRRGRVRVYAGGVVQSRYLATVRREMPSSRATCRSDRPFTWRRNLIRSI